MLAKSFSFPWAIRFEKFGDANLFGSQRRDVESNERLILINDLSDLLRRDRVMDVLCSKHDNAGQAAR